MSILTSTSGQPYDATVLGRALKSAIPQDPTSNTLLTYAALVSPEPLQETVTGMITLVVSNSGQQAITVTRIVVMLPVGTNASDLVSVATGIQTQVPTQWQAALDGGAITFTPQTPGAGVIKGGGVSFVIAALPVNAQPGTATVTITETASSPSQPAQPRTATLSIPKFPIQFQVSDLQANPLDVAAGGATTLMWSGSTGATYTLDYQPADQGPPVSLSVSNVGPYVAPNLTRAGSVEFALTVKVVVPGQDQPLTVQRHAAVSVETLSLDFTGVPTTVGPNGLVHLSWTTANANSCTLDPGVGSVPTSGELYLVVPQTRVYTLTAYGLARGVKQGQLTVTVDSTIKPNVAGPDIVGHDGARGANGRDAIPQIMYSTPGAVGGAGESAEFTGELPPLDASSSPSRVISITLTGGKGGDGGTGGNCQEGSEYTASDGGDGGPGGNATLAATFDSAAGAPAQYIVSVSAGAGGAGGKGGTGSPGVGVKDGDDGPRGVVAMTFNGFP